MKKWTAAALAALTALTLTGCSFQDVMLYLYGGDSFVTSAEPDYTTCDGDNGVTVVYDQNQWEQPVMAQDDTLSPPSIRQQASNDSSASMLCGGVRPPAAGRGALSPHICPDIPKESL